MLLNQKLNYTPTICFMFGLANLANSAINCEIVHHEHHLYGFGLVLVAGALSVLTVTSLILVAVSAVYMLKCAGSFREQHAVLLALAGRLLMIMPAVAVMLVIALSFLHMQFEVPLLRDFTLQSLWIFLYGYLHIHAYAVVDNDSCN